MGWSVIARRSEWFAIVYPETAGFIAALEYPAQTLLNHLDWYLAYKLIGGKRGPLNQAPLFSSAIVR